MDDESTSGVSEDTKTTSSRIQQATADLGIIYTPTQIIMYNYIVTLHRQRQKRKAIMINTNVQ